MNAVEEYVSGFCNDKLSFDVIRKGKKYFSVGAEVEKVLSSVDKEAYAFGRFLGEDKKEFVPSVSLLDEIGANSKKKIWVDSHVAWLFLCGKDVFWKSVQKSTTEKGNVLVLNEYDEVLGTGKIVTQKGKKIVLNTFDKGDFLRREKR